MTREAKGTRKPHVVIIGTRGYPNYYGGFETAVRYIAPALADAGWRVTVYGRAGGSSLTRGAADGRVEVKETWGIDSKSLSTLSYGLSACLHAAVRRPQVALVMNVANGYWLPILRLAGVPAIVNVDGLEWLRDKWGRFAKLVFRGGAMMSARLAPKLIADARAIQQYWGDHYNRELVFIPYGAEERGPLEVPLGLHRRAYVLFVARFVAENTVEEFFQAAELIASECDVVIVGSSGYTSELDDRAQRLDERHASVRWLGHVANDDLLHALWQNCGAYFHGHSVGGTNPALVQAMMLGAPILARDTIYNREVLGESAIGFVEPDGFSIAKRLARVLQDAELQAIESRRVSERARAEYSWKRVTDAYEETARSLLRDGRD